jgi:hypothetical protein
MKRQFFYTYFLYWFVFCCFSVTTGCALFHKDIIKSPLKKKTETFLSIEFFNQPDWVILVPIKKENINKNYLQTIRGTSQAFWVHYSHFRGKSIGTKQCNRTTINIVWNGGDSDKIFTSFEEIEYMERNRPMFYDDYYNWSCEFHYTASDSNSQKQKTSIGLSRAVEVAYILTSTSLCK